MRTTVATWAAWAELGRICSSGSRSFRPSAGAPSSSSTAMTATATGTGRRMTKVASRCQKPDSSRSSARSLRWNSRHLSIRGPIQTSSAGTTTSEATAASSAVAIDAYAIESKMVNGKTSSAPSATATVTAEKTTVRPEVRSMVRIAAGMSWPRRSSSR